MPPTNDGAGVPGPLATLGQEILDKEQEALWELRRRHKINNDDPNGWKNLSLILARQAFYGFPWHEESYRRALATALNETASKVGRKEFWTKQRKDLLLSWVESWKFNESYRGTKLSDSLALRGLKSEHSEIYEQLVGRAGDRRLINMISEARQERDRDNEAALLANALNDFHGN